ncbi:hypothetical protein MOD69_19425 [Bacillus inaquosorum]|uniref:hypothetical protein n=1 Tax=Bacillus inaquosorum TaxID=483913 RepID=UPI0022808837|nr:hypothetical protein [Bacillus inaquosorum]MCY8729451.1 hypothetical protein [Bacillus inaquosorum]
MSDKLTDFLAGKKREKENEQNIIQLAWNSNLEKFRSLINSMKLWLEESKNNGFVTFDESNNRYGLYDDVIGLVLRFEEKMILIVSPRKDFERKDQIKVHFVLGGETVPVNDLYLEIRQGTWFLVDNRSKNDSKETVLEKDNFQELLISLIS